MACREMGQYYDAMTADMGSKMSGYLMGLQERFGDPRAYAAQKQEIAAQSMAVASKSKQRAAELLEGAYADQQKKNREAHLARMSKRQESQS